MTADPTPTPDDDDDDLRAAFARLPQPSPAEQLAQLRAIREAAAETLPPPLSIIPTPEPVRVQPGLTVYRFPCPLGCPWSHVESPSTEPVLPLVLPFPYTSQDVNDALTAHANASNTARMARIETSITRHYDAAHPGR